MLGHDLAQALQLGADGPRLIAFFALLAFCGLLRPLGPRARVERPRRARPEDEPTPIITLNAIELGLLAELSLEQARAHEEVVKDAFQRPEARRAAAGTAAAWRERARTYQLQARRQGAAPIVPGGYLSRAYTGPERRRQIRRRETRRTRGRAAGGVGRADRRTGHDRRQADRRRPELAPH